METPEKNLKDLKELFEDYKSKFDNKPVDERINHYLQDMQHLQLFESESVYGALGVEDSGTPQQYLEWLQHVTQDLLEGRDYYYLNGKTYFNKEITISFVLNMDAKLKLDLIKTYMEIKGDNNFILNF